MKNITKIILALTAILTFSCSKDDKGKVDMGEFYGPYIYFNSASAQTVTAGGAEAKIPVTIYIPVWKDFDVQYELRANYNLSGSYTVTAGNRADAISLTVPLDPSITTTVVDTLYLISATNGVKIGRQNVPSNNIIKKLIKIVH